MKVVRNMGHAVSLIVLVAAGEAASPTAAAMVRAARDALGVPSVELRETAGSPTDAEALAAEAQSRSDAAVELIWDASDPRRVTLRIHLARTQRWLEKSMAYIASDPASERGRALGLAIASTLPEIEVAPEAVPPDRPVPTQRAAGEPAPERTTVPTPETAVVPPPNAPPGAPVGASPATATSRAADPTEAAQTRGLAGRPHLELDLLATGAAGIGGSGNTAGGGGGVQWFPARYVSLTLGASERSGTLNVAEASVFVFLAAAGVAFHPWPATRARPFDLSIRADYLLVRQSATHFDADDPHPVTEARWVSGADAFLDTGWLLTSDVAALVGLGLEDVMAPTYVEVRGARVATVPELRVLAEAGFRLRF